MTAARPDYGARAATPRLPSRCVWVAGTREMGADSDIDFLVEFENGYKLRDHIRLIQGLQRLLGRRVDVVDRRCLREQYRATHSEGSSKPVTKGKRPYCRWASGFHDVGIAAGWSHPQL